MTSTGYRLATSQTGIPSVAIDMWSERLGSTLFEPLEDHEGNGARAMLTVFARWTAACGAYNSAMVNELVAWHEADPVDEVDWARHEYIAELQGGGTCGRNPSIVDPTLVRRTTLPGTVDGEPSRATTARTITVHPNPASTSATVRVATSGGAAVPDTVLDVLGRVV